MRPNVCPCCGLPLAVNQAGQSIVCCPISPEIEHLQEQIWADYNQARFMQSLDYGRYVSTNRGYLTLMDFVQYYDHPDLVWESVLKVTDKELLQVVYLNGRGCKLLKWPLLPDFIDGEWVP
jgi:hypothetical protein